jgi:hypothetical protein
MPSSRLPIMRLSTRRRCHRDRQDQDQERDQGRARGHGREQQVAEVRDPSSRADLVAEEVGEERRLPGACRVVED